MKFDFSSIVIIVLLSVVLTACSQHSNTAGVTASDEADTNTAVPATTFIPSYGFKVHKDPVSGQFTETPVTVPTLTDSAATITRKVKTKKYVPEILQSEDGSSYIVVPHNR